MRRAHGSEAAARTLSLRLDYRPPLDWDGLLAFLGDRATPGVEEVGGGAYRRVIEIDGKTGTVAVRADGARPALWVEASLPLIGGVMKLVARLRHLFDLDARPDAIAGTLSRDPLLAPLVARRPGLRVPGSVDPFETTVRAILGPAGVGAGGDHAGRPPGRALRPSGAHARPQPEPPLPRGRRAGPGGRRDHRRDRSAPRPRR